MVNHVLQRMDHIIFMKKRKASLTMRTEWFIVYKGL